MSKKFYVTTPIYYVNDKPHIGHAYTTILADVLARYHRMWGEETFFLTGTDEHGQKVQQSAQKRNVPPKQHCDEMVVYFKDAWKRLNISEDYFIRTTDENHKKVVQAVLQEIYDKGEIYADEYGGYYCVGCERFYTQKELEDGKCPQHKVEPSYIKEKNYFFRMSRYRDWLIGYIEEHPEFIRPETRRNEILGFLQQELGDLCISRPKKRLEWGIELPFDRDYVTYVWFDALLNYVTGVGYKQDKNEFEKWWPADFHLIGKDILTTHCVYWPTMLKAMGLSLPRTIFAHGWWLSGEAKMSKSLKNIVSPLDLIDDYGVDSVRYYLIRDMVLGQDANFTADGFVRRYNSDLANDFGNLINRITTLLNRHFDGRLPESSVPDKDGQYIINGAKQLSEEMQETIERLKLSEAIEEILQYIRGINRYMEQKQPWKLVKEDRDAAGTVLSIALEGVRFAAVWLYPIMPGKIGEFFRILKIDEKSLLKPEWGVLKSGDRVAKSKGLFPRIQNLTKDRKEMKEAQETPVEENLLSIEEFARFDFRVATVLEAEKISGTDKLLKLQVEMSGEKRQLVAGIAQHYSPEELKGKKVVIVANLKPAVIRGVESHGMVLAAVKGKKLSLITPDGEIASGAKVR